MEEMRKRAQRYQQAPVEDAGKALAEVDARNGGDGSVQRAQSMHNSIFLEHPIAVGKAISKKERDQMGKAASSALTYGECVRRAALPLHLPL
jgi:hypothetical protein